MRKRLLFGFLVILLLVSAPTVTSAGNWWDKLGKPQYGGTISFRVTGLHPVFDTYTFNPGGKYMWIENMFAPDWALDRKTWAYNTYHVPMKYMKCHLLGNWEQPDPRTLILHVNKAVHWQNKKPVNGRAMNAHDLEYYFHRMLGMGSGYTRPLPMYAAIRELVKSITVTDDYTIIIKFTKPGMGTLWNFVQIGPSTRIEPPEVLEASGGSVKNWRDVVGTGAWMLTGFIAESSATFVKNPDYWGFDERYPKNRLPYADHFKVLCIPDMATAIAAFRTGKLDIMEEIDLNQSLNIAKSNPELKQVAIPFAGYGINMRVDMAPFKDIRVRKALQLSLNRKSIASGYYHNTVEDIPAGHVLPAHKVCNYPYNEWPQKLRDEYSYNPGKARKLLAEAGYPNGFKTTMLANAVEDLQLAQVVKANLRDIGVDVTIDVRDEPTLIGILNSRKHKAMVFGRTTNNMNLSMTSHHFYSKEMNLNRSAVNSPEYDVLYEKFNAAATEDEALKIMKAMDKLGLEQHWQIQLFPIHSYNIYQPYIKGYSGEIFSAFELGSFYFNRLWLNQSLKKSMR